MNGTELGPYRDVQSEAVSQELGMKASKAVRKSRQLVGKRREVGRPLVLLLSKHDQFKPVLSNIHSGFGWTRSSMFCCNLLSYIIIKRV